VTNGPLLRAGGSTRAWRRMVAYVLARDGHLCQRVVDEHGTRCGRPATTCGHIIARYLWPDGVPGVDDPTNLRAECVRCNMSHGGRVSQALQAARGASREW